MSTIIDLKPNPCMRTLDLYAVEFDWDGLVVEVQRKPWVRVNGRDMQWETDDYLEVCEFGPNPYTLDPIITEFILNESDGEIALRKYFDVERARDRWFLEWISSKEGRRNLRAAPDPFDYILDSFQEILNKYQPNKKAVQALKWHPLVLCDDCKQVD